MGCIPVKDKDSPAVRRRGSLHHYLANSGHWVADNSSYQGDKPSDDQPEVLEGHQGEERGAPGRLPVTNADDKKPCGRQGEERGAPGRLPVTNYANNKKPCGSKGAQCSELEEKKKRGTAASNVLRSYFAKLCKQLRDPQPVARALFAEGIIDNQLLQQASNPHESVSKRVQDVLSDLYLKVQARPEWMETVCDIFKEEAVPYAWDIRVDYRVACGDPVESEEDTVKKAPQLEAQVGRGIPVFPPAEPLKKEDPTELELDLPQAPPLTVDTIVEEFERTYSEGGLEKACTVLDRCDPKSDAAKVLLIALVQRSRELPGCVEMVLAHGFPPDFTWSGFSPIQCACANGLKDAAQHLQSRPEVNLSLCTKEGKGLLHLACEKEHLDVLEILLSGRSSPVDLGINVKDVDGNTPLHIACRGKNIAASTVVQFDKPRQIVEVLFRYGANPELKNKAGNTPVHVACLDIEDRFDVVELLLDKLRPGCIDVQNENGDTCLHIACRHNSKGLVNLLLSAGSANPGLLNKEGYTPLQVGCVKGYKDIVILILNKHPSTLYSADSDLCSPLHLSCMNRHVDIACELASRLPKDRGDELVRSNQSGNSPLHIACEVNNLGLVKALLEAMHARKLCSPYLVNNKGYTPLHFASEQGNLDIVTLLVKHSREHRNSMEFLGHQNELGNTALHVAARYGYMSIVEHLKKKGASKRVRNKVGKTPADVAYYHQQYTVSQRLGMKDSGPNASPRERQPRVRVCSRRSSSAYSSAGDGLSFVSRTSGETSSLGLSSEQKK